MTKTILEEYLPAYSNAIKTCEELEKIQDNKIEQLEKRLEVSEKEHYRTLEQLRIATKALKDTKKHIEDFNDDPMNKIRFMAWGTLHECLGIARKALKEMKGVK